MKQKILILLLSITGFFTACTDDYVADSSYWKHPEERNDTPLMREARMLVEDTGGALALPNMEKTFAKASTRGSAKTLQTLSNGDFSLEWNKAQTIQEDDGEVLLIPIKTKYVISMRRHTLIKNKKGSEMTPMYFMLSLKNFKSTGRTISHIISYAPGRQYMLDKKNKMDHLTHDPRGTDYTGMCLVSTLNGFFLRGINYEEGHEQFRFYTNPLKFKQHTCNDAECSSTEQHNNIEKTVLASANRVNIEIVSSKGATRVISYYSDSEYDIEVEGCLSCGDKTDSCNCFVITCNSCNVVPCYCSEVFTCDICGETERCKCDASIIDEEKEKEGGDITTPGGGGTSVGGGGGTIGGSGGTTGGSGGGTVSGNQAKFNDLMPKIKAELRLKGVNVDRYSFMYSINCASNARIDALTGDIQICSEFFSKGYTLKDQISIVWHECYHFDNDLSWDNKQFIEYKDNENVWVRFKDLPEEQKAYLLSKYKDEPRSSFFIQKTLEEEIEYYELRQKYILEPSFYLNEINSYEAEIRACGDVSSQYDAERQFALYRNTQLYNLSKKLYGK